MTRKQECPHPSVITDGIWQRPGDPIPDGTKYAECGECGESLPVPVSRVRKVTRKSGLTDDERASELVACADHDDSDYADDDWFAPPSIATKAERLGWHRHFSGMDAPDGGAQLVGWLAREIAISDELRRREELNDGWAWDVSRPIAEQLAETAREDAEAREVTTDDIHSPNCDVLTDAVFPCNCGDSPSPADRLLADLAADAAGRNPVAEQLAEELCDDILPDEVAS